MKILLILVILMQLFVLIGICRTNHKINGFNDLILQDVGTNAKNTLNITRILSKLADAVIELHGMYPTGSWFCGNARKKEEKNE